MKLLMSLMLILPLYGDMPFKIGEELNYNASFGSIDAARGSLKVLKKELINNIMTYHVRFSARSKGVINYLFPIDDQIDIWLNEHSLLPIKILANIREGKFKKQSETYINHESGYAVTNGDTIEILNDIHSPHSLFYFFVDKKFPKWRARLLKQFRERR